MSTEETESLFVSWPNRRQWTRRMGVVTGGGLESRSRGSEGRSNNGLFNYGTLIGGEGEERAEIFSTHSSSLDLQGFFLRVSFFLSLLSLTWRLQNIRGRETRSLFILSANETQMTL